jgi:aspartate 1-decarboxylase
MLKAKFHSARVTHAEPDYEGSCAIDADLLRAANIHEFEQIQIYNVTNGERFTTYAIQAEKGSGVISINGAAAHRAAPRDKIIICAYCGLEQKEVARFKPSLVYLDPDNRIVRTSNTIPVQAA